MRETGISSVGVLGIWWNLRRPVLMGEQYSKWSIADLPILPQKWQYLVSANTKKQFSILKKLMRRADVEMVVNSCDAGREGELIFRLVYEQAGCKSRFPGYGCPVWRTMPFGRALRTSDRQLNTMHCIRLHCAGSAPIGKSASTAPGYFPAYMVGLWR